MKSRTRSLAIAVLVLAGAAVAAGTAPRALADPTRSGDCQLIVPADPLTPQGLATPYKLNPSGGCAESSAATGAFVQATILRPDGTLAVYDPLVTDTNKDPATPPVVPSFPPGSVVTIDTGFDGNVLDLIGPGAGAFVQGGPDGSPFGQVAFANGAAFFAAAAAMGVMPTPPGTAKDGQQCPTVRSFSLVDQDPSDNVTTKYLVTNDGKTAQDTAANIAALGGAATVINPSDNTLLDDFVDPALGCTPFMAPDLADPGQLATSQALDELQAGAFPDPAGIALVPVNDPMTTVGSDADINAGQLPTAANLNAAKTDAYRTGVGQPPVTGDLTAAATAYCTSLNTVATARLALDAPLEQGPQPIVPGESLSTFLMNRMQASLQLLNCQLFGGITPAATATPVVSPSVTVSPTQAASASVSPSPSASAAGSPSPSASGTGSPIPSASGTGSNAPTVGTSSSAADSSDPLPTVTMTPPAPTVTVTVTASPNPPAS